MKKQSKSQPIICGIDIGAWTVKISYYDGSKFEILTNQANFRETPSLVAFTPLQRMIGEPANLKMNSNFTNTIRSPSRLIGIGKSPHFIQQELKYSTVNYDLDQTIEFQVKHGDQNIKLAPQQILMALMSKVKEIVSIHNYHIYASYIAIPSYLTNNQRSSIRKCAQILKLGKVRLVDDWVCISSQYSFNRIKQLQAQYQRNVVFIDVGYSKFSIYAIQFTPTKCKLIDYEHLKYTGSKNMDNCLIQFYDDLFYKNSNGKQNQKIIFNSKALIKLQSMIQKQRKALSGNTEHHLNIQYLLNDEDLSYNMKREQFQQIIMPILSQMASALNNIKSRLGPLVKLHAVNLIGGASRIPMIQNIVTECFQMQPAKTLNSSESMARGAAVFGSIDTGFINFPYQVSIQSFTAVSIAWNSVKNQNYLGENIKQYKNKKIVFDWGCRYPCESSLDFGPEGLVQVFLYYQHEIALQSIGYLRVTTPSKVVITMDQDRILSAKCIGGNFLIYNFHEIKQQKWQKMQQLQNKFQQNDKRIITIYDIKNKYQSMIYKTRENISNDWIKYSSISQKQNINEMLLQAQKWIQKQNQKKKYTQEDVKQYNNRMDQLNSLMQIMRNRKRNYDQIQNQYRQFLEKAKNKVVSNANVKKQLQDLVLKIQSAYRSMEKNLYETQELTVADIRQATRHLSRLM